MNTYKGRRIEPYETLPTCTDCGRPLRPFNIPAAAYPNQNTTARRTRTLCAHDADMKRRTPPEETIRLAKAHAASWFLGRRRKLGLPLNTPLPWETPEKAEATL